MQDVNGFSAEEMAMLLPLFTQSSSEYLGQFRAALRKVAAGMDEDPDREVLQRSVHSLKGAALQLGILHVGQLALAVEAVAKALRDAPQALEASETDLLGLSADRLETYITDLADGAASNEPPVDLILRLEAASDRLVVAGAADGDAEGGAAAAQS